MASIYFVCHPYNTPHKVKYTICRWNTTRDHWRMTMPKKKDFSDILK